MSLSSNAPLVDYELELSNASRGVWLVKVPKYIAEIWEKAPGNIEVGKLRISKTPRHQTRVQLSLSNTVLSLNEETEKDIPKEHHLDVSTITRQSLGVFAHSAPDTDAVVPEPEKMFMEGRIVQKLECRPFANRAYYKSKSESIRMASMPRRKVKQLEGPVINFKPRSNQPSNVAYLKQKAAEGKRSRDDKDVVLNMLFAAFEKHQYYNLKDLCNITRQPVGYLKEVLLEVCNYNSKNPHKGMWELKPEFRHYSQEQPVLAKKDIKDSDSD